MDQSNVLELLHEIRDGWDEKAIGDDRESMVRHWVEALEVSQGCFEEKGHRSDVAHALNKSPTYYMI